MKTYFPKEGEISNDWCVMNADGVVLGRLAARVAMILRGKTKPVFTPMPTRVTLSSSSMPTR